MRDLPWLGLLQQDVMVHWEVSPVTTIPQSALETYLAQVLGYLEIGTVIVFPIFHIVQE